MSERRTPGVPSEAASVAAGFIVLALSNAAGFYGLAVYLGGLQAEGRFSVGLLSAFTSLFFLTGGVAGLAVGRSVSVLGVRRMVILGALISAVGMWLVGQASHPVSLGLAYLLLGAGSAATGPIVLTTGLIDAVSDAKRRNTAMAIMLSGMTAGGAVFVPLLAWGVETHGLGLTTTVGALLLGPGLLMPAVVFRSEAQRLGARRLSAGPHDASKRVRTAPARQDDAGSVPWGAAGSRGAFMLVASTFVLFLGVQVGFNTQLYAIAGDYGIRSAGGALGVVAGVGMVARLIGIVLIRWVVPELFLAAMAICQGFAALVLLLFPHQGGLYVSAALLGMAVGNASVLSPIIVLKVFGRKHYSSLLARLSFIMTLGISAGPALVGAGRAFAGQYDPVLTAVSAASFIVAGMCYAMARVGRISL